MKKELKIKEISLILSIFGLVLLLLFSPCKVRNFIQVELGIPQTDVLNKSQSIVYQSDCITFEVSKTVQSYTKPSLHHPDFFFTEIVSLEPSSNQTILLSIPFASENKLTSDVPLYILYQNLKIYA
ncbi:MAG: hypothetical protein GX921_00220 [Bacteroidales bacterium]|nr:hypothetical protein [Bacteroidales bacterium]